VRRPRLLDAYCGAGGATRGYQRAGFHVTGVDLAPMPRYCGDAFHQGDAIEFIREHGHEFDVIHASPPCQRFSAMSECRPGLADGYPDLIAATRDALNATGRPWVIENVVGAPLRNDGADALFDTGWLADCGEYSVELCGHMFGLALYRHRVFESNVPLTQPVHVAHTLPSCDAGHWRPGQIISVSGNCAPIALAREAMGIDWMTRAELAEAIPPAYTELVGAQLLRSLSTTEDGTAA